MKYYLLLLGFLLAQVASCNRAVVIDDIKNIPETLAADEVFANVYQSLDGVWEGEFIIFEDTQLKDKSEVELINIDAQSVKRAGLKEVNRIQVRQEYLSETPYFQKVKITDTYPENKKQEISVGVNKVQDGKMWCVVRKPSETVIHAGSLDGSKTIIWQRQESKPQRIEYFRETVEDQSYEIVGWGYYEGDNPTLSPKLWFYAKYIRQ